MGIRKVGTSFVYAQPWLSVTLDHFSPYRGVLQARVGPGKEGTHCSGSKGLLREACTQPNGQRTHDAFISAVTRMGSDFNARHGVVV